CINAKERLGVLSVPRGAVEIEGGRRYVYVVKLGQLGMRKSMLEKREIRVGIVDVVNYEGVSGLEESEPGTLRNDVDLRNGMSVIVVNSTTARFQRRTNG